MKYITRKKVIQILRLICVFLLGYFFQGLISKGESLNMGEIRQFEVDGTFSYINPLLECDLGKEFIAQGKPRPYVTDVQNYIDIQKVKGNISEASFYYRDLNNGPWVGINEKELFFPASLLKLPIAMYFYKESETKEGFLSTAVTAPQVVYETTVEQLYPAEKSVVAGTKYSYRELINYALRYSDNDAASILQNISGGTHIEEMFKELHLDVDLGAPERNGMISVRDYAAFFRILYNTSYLSQDNSTEILQLLSSTTFSHGIRKFIPEDIKISHKFGEINLDDYGYSQLHDCGVVYYPSHPYVLCIMTRGNDKTKLADTIANISRMVYEQIKSQVD